MPRPQAAQGLVAVLAELNHALPHPISMLLCLIPKVFYADLKVGLDLFVRGVGCEVAYQDDNITVLEREGIKVYLMQNAELAIETDDIEAMHAEVLARAPDLLHPNCRNVSLRPWGAREFALLDSTTVCVVFRQWDD
jgi:hypothetical protein